MMRIFCFVFFKTGILWIPIYDQFADDDEIKESNNPLYCSRSEMQ